MNCVRDFAAICSEVTGIGTVYGSNGEVYAKDLYLQKIG